MENWRDMEATHKSFRSKSFSLTNPIPNIKVFEEVAKKELESKRALQNYQNEVNEKKKVLESKLNDVKKISKQKHLIQENCVVFKEKLQYLLPEKNELNKELKELVMKEHILKAKIKELEKVYSGTIFVVESYKRKIDLYKREFENVESNSELCKQLRCYTKENEKIEINIKNIQQNIKEFTLAYDKTALCNEIKTLNQSKIRLINILEEKNKEVEVEDNLHHRATQEREVMWKCHQAKKRRLRSEIARVAQVREQQYIEVNRLKERIRILKNN